MARRNVFTIPPGLPFLDTLVEAIFDGRLLGGLAPAGSPFALADLTLYLPTRRAARAVRDSFLACAGRPLLLPRIRTLGDIDEDDAPPDSDVPDLPPAVSATSRQLVLTRLVLGWSGAMARAAADLPDEELLVPSSPADAARLAAALGRLIDQVGTEPAAWRGLFSGIPADLARYWEITLTFLEIATASWPDVLAERGRIDPGRRRDLLIRGEAERLARFGSPAPVIGAGSTGSVPATAALLSVIAGLPNGAVVLPGLDQHLDPESWAEIGPSEREPAGAGHPQYGLKKLLEALGVRRDSVDALGAPAPPMRARARLLSDALRPAGTTDLWSARTEAPGRNEALAGIGILEAANEREEALAVAVLLRGAAETPGAVAALVTPDRGLARRVAVELRRWDIEVDDSAGTPLVRTPAGVFARLLAEVALDGAAADKLLAFLKHPLAAFGSAPAETHRAARALERAVLRGPRLRPGLASVRTALAHLGGIPGRARDASEPGREAARRLTEADWRSAAELLARVEAALAPLEALASRSDALLAELVEAHAGAVETAMRLAPGAALPPASAESVEALLRALEALREDAADGPVLAGRDYPALFAALVESVVVRARGARDPRIHIWGALEARLQSVDVAVLGGLNEGTWPGQTRLDPLLSRPMRAALALEPPERRIGLAAHDFAQALGHSTVWLTRAERQDNEPRVASRWLQRLTACAGPDAASALRARGDAILAEARRLDRPQAGATIARPCPAPPPALRPKRLSATAIETLIRDPYAVYARHVLKLRPFEAIAEEPGAADRGNLLHAILERFVGERPAGPFDGDAEARLTAIGQEEFARHADFPEVGTLWWPRFLRAARWFLQQEGGRADVLERLVEGSGSWAVTPDFLLTARADRLDRLADGRLGIVDYKTGTPPGPDEVLSLAPQLPLEALIAGEGGFPALGRAETARLEYYYLSGRGEGGQALARGTRDGSRDRPAVTLPEALALTRARLLELVAFYADPETGYLSRKIPRRARDFRGDYDHLARVAEWSVSEGAEADEA